MAVEDLERILDYLAVEAGREAASVTGRRFLAGIESLRRFPKRCRVVPELARVGMTDFRELIVDPYRTFFRIHGAAVQIVGVLDGRRDIEELLVTRGLSR